MLTSELNMPKNDFLEAFPVVHKTKNGINLWQRGRSYHSEGLAYFAHLSCIQSGSVTLKLDGQEYEVDRGHMIFLPGGKRFSLEFSETEESLENWIDYYGPEQTELVNKKLEAVKTVTPLSTKMAKFWETYALPNPYSSPNDRFHFDIFQLHFSISILSMFFMEAFYHLTADTPVPAQKKHERIYNTAIQYIILNFRNDIKEKDIADHCGITERHLRSIFKQCDQISPSSYLWEIRLQEAIRLLKTSSKNTKELLTLSGFKSKSHFFRKIKEYTGKTANYIREHPHEH